MGKKKFKKSKNSSNRKKKLISFSLPEQTKRFILGVLMFLAAAIVAFSFFDKAGIAGGIFLETFTFLIGKTIFLLPLFFVLGGLIFLKNVEISKYKTGSVILGIAILTLGVSGILGGLEHSSFSPIFGEKAGGVVGYLISLPAIKSFGFLIAEIIFFVVFIIGGIIIWEFLVRPEYLKQKPVTGEIAEQKPSFIKKIFQPKFKVKEVPPVIEIRPPEVELKKSPFPEFKTKPVEFIIKSRSYEPPVLDLLDSDKGMPNFGDIRVNSTIIKKTLANFAIPVEMSEVNIGPTVTQYTLRPAEGVKLSKITALSSDLALALSAKSIRIEAPIPGRPLVGIEVPNKSRTMVRLRNLLESPAFQSAPSALTFALGRDVADNAIFADLSRMPHLLVAGSTGTGKTICLNAIILSLLYRSGPDILKFILIDPKRVEFTAYHDLPHLLAPVIFDAQKTVNALKWLIGEMERRFDVLSLSKARDIAGYNEMAVQKMELKEEYEEYMEPLPYIVVIVDELADLMAARGREMEAGIVRLAQMARAVGIHLILATQRPSVEVITGLIKANITSRITFQVASQVDSRTVLDTAGAEKLLGAGDMLFVSAEIIKPKRIQGAYVSEKEIKKVVSFLKKQKLEIEQKELEVSDESLLKELPQAELQREELFQDESLKEEAFEEENTRPPDITEPHREQVSIQSGEETEEARPDSGQSLENALEDGVKSDYLFTGEEDPLYEEAKKVVIEARKASASLLQRRLRIGYARAARLIDTLEERGAVGPGDGAKPREVYLERPETPNNS